MVIGLDGRSGHRVLSLVEPVSLNEPVTVPILLPRKMDGYAVQE